MLCEFHLNLRKIHIGPQVCQVGSSWAPTHMACTNTHTQISLKFREVLARGRNTLSLQGVPGRNTQAIHSSGPAFITVTRFHVVEHGLPSFGHVSYPLLSLFCITHFIFSPPALAFLCYRRLPAELFSRLINESPHYVTLALFCFTAQSALLLAFTLARLSHQTFTISL